MTTMIACVIAAISTTGCAALWFLIARRELRAKRDTVSSAESQLTACRISCVQAGNALGTQAVLHRCRDIYLQAVALYNEALQKPQNRIPGFFLGYRPLPGGANNAMAAPRRAFIEDTHTIQRRQNKGEF